jgi:hypothetical protein
MILMLRPPSFSPALLQVLLLELPVLLGCVVFVNKVWVIRCTCLLNVKLMTL